MSRTKEKRIFTVVLIALSACVIYGVSSGLRANYGVMLDAISTKSGVDYASISFVMAVSQLMVGIVQPLFGVVALKKGNSFVLCLGAVMIAVGLLAIPYCHSTLSLLLFLGIILSGGTGAMAFGVVMGAVTPALGEKKAAMLSGFVSASSGLGGTVLAPVMQGLIERAGLRMMLIVLCIPVILLIPISLWLSKAEKGAKEVETVSEQQSPSLRSLAKDAAADKSYLCVAGAFFTCGFHMVIIETHLFSQYVSYGFTEQSAALAFSVYGVAAMLGCIINGVLDSRFPNKWILGSTYAVRIPIVLGLLLLQKTPLLLYGSAALLGLTGNATVPPTSGLIGKLWGTERLAALFGIAFLFHQIGGFFSGWLGGLCVSATGGYTLIWCVSMALSALAALASFQIKEQVKGIGNANGHE